MNVSDTLDHQINRAAFWSAAIALATGVVSFFFPLDAPGGYEATTPERVAWLSANTGPFILGWINQIVSMVTLSGLFAGIAWQIAYTHPLRAILAGTLVCHGRLLHPQVHRGVDHPHAGRSHRDGFRD